MLILLLRHGQAENHAASDQARPLTERGREDNQATASQLVPRQPDITAAMVSPYLRARQTADDIAAFYPGLDFLETEALVPEASLDALVALLSETGSSGDHESLLLVGHNPLISRLMSWLVEGEHSAGRYLDTSQLVCIETPVVAPACGVIKYSLTPAR